MDITNIIEVTFGSSHSVSLDLDTAYLYNSGIYLKPTDLDLPESYQVHFANSKDASTSLEVIGTSADGALIPYDVWENDAPIYAWYYLHPTEDSAVTAYAVQIFKHPRAGLPDGTEPTPSEQSTIDTLITALNTAVEDAQDAQSAIENMTVSAESLAEGSTATVTKTTTDGVVNLAFGIPIGATGAKGDKGDKGEKGDTGAQGAKGDKGDKGDTGTTGAKGDKGDKGDTGAQGIQGEQGIQGIQGEKGEKGDKGDKGEQGEQGEVTTAELLKAFPTDTASGAVASFTDGANLPLKSLVVGIEPVQDLSNGDPSPTNICPISGWTGANIDANGTTITIQFGQTVFSANIDVLTGVLTVDRAIVDLGTLIWNYYTGNTNLPVFYARLDDMVISNINSAICSALKCTNWQSLMARTDKTICPHPSAALVYVADADRTDHDASAFTSSVTGVQYCYKLATPIEIQLDAHTLNSLYGQNNIYADTGDTSVEYRADPTLYVTRKIAEAVSALS